MYQQRCHRQLVLAESGKRERVGQVHAIAPKDPSLKMYHVMSVKQTLREDLAEFAFQVLL